MNLSFVPSVLSVLLDLFFPKKCVGCNKEGDYFCSSCVSNILQRDLVCPRCDRLAVGGQTHPICRRRYGLDGLWSLGIYQDPLKKAIQQLKYKWVSQLADVLVDITLEYFAKYQPFVFDQIKESRGEGWVIIPIPLHWWKQNSRGFNQSSLIGQMLSKKLGLDYCEGLKRIRFTKAQVKLKGRQRYQNIRNAFSHNTKYIIRNTNVLLIDDVWTTGSTMKECCYILKRAGAKKVWGITLAK